MPNNEIFASGTLFGFLFVLARVSGIFVFAPIPGLKEGMDSVRVLLSLAITVALFPVWPHILAADETLGKLTATLLSEAALGITIGLSVSLVLEAMQMAAQVAGLQAGYGYASTIDPSTQADSSVLLTFAQLLAGLLFFATGLDREILRVCASSLQSFPPGQFALSPDIAATLIRLSAGLFSMGVRLALPIVALLGMVDLSLALLGRINAQLQLVTLAFPVKMLAALVLFGVMAGLFQRVFASYSSQVIQVLRQMLNLSPLHG
jgi:flagellar biosynthetic protein FliR